MRPPAIPPIMPADGRIRPQNEHLASAAVVGPSGSC
jgi:hypothetical protein